MAPRDPCRSMVSASRLDHCRGILFDTKSTFCSVWSYVSYDVGISRTHIQAHESYECVERRSVGHLACRDFRNVEVIGSSGLTFLRGFCFGKRPYVINNSRNSLCNHTIVLV